MKKIFLIYMVGNAVLWEVYSLIMAVIYGKSIFNEHLPLFAFGFILINMFWNSVILAWTMGHMTNGEEGTNTNSR